MPTICALLKFSSIFLLKSIDIKMGIVESLIVMNAKPIVEASHLEIGDVVTFLGRETDVNLQMTVIQKTEKKMKLFRPFVCLGDFIHSGGVTPYIGIEEILVLLPSSMKYVKLGNIYRGTK